MHWSNVRAPAPQIVQAVTLEGKDPAGQTPKEFDDAGVETDPFAHGRQDEAASEE